MEMRLLVFKNYASKPGLHQEEMESKREWNSLANAGNFTFPK